MPDGDGHINRQSAGGTTLAPPTVPHAAPNSVALH
jgi:hypothetical protein